MTARLGIGVSGPLGQAWFSAEKTRSLIRLALDEGVDHFDTAPFYFDAEARLGAALRGAGAKPFVSTKTGTRREGRRLVKDFSERGMRADVEQSLKRLDRGTLDLLYLHGPSSEEIDAALPTLLSLKHEGKVARIGVCGEGAPLLHAIDAGFDAIMAVYNLIDRRHEATFERAKARGTMTVAIAPLAQGSIDATFKTPADAADVWRLARATFRGRYRREDISAAREALAKTRDPIAAALGFVTANPAIDVVMTTTTKAEHLAQSLKAARSPLGPTVLAALQRLPLTGPGAAPS